MDPTVHRCDFLQLHVTAPDAPIVVTEATQSATSAGDLVSMPAGSFDVLVFSLVLSYLPHPMLRTQVNGPEWALNVH